MASPIAIGGLKTGGRIVTVTSDGFGPVFASARQQSAPSPPPGPPAARQRFTLQVKLGNTARAFATQSSSAMGVPADGSAYIAGGGPVWTVGPPSIVTGDTTNETAGIFWGSFGFAIPSYAIVQGLQFTITGSNSGSASIAEEYLCQGGSVITGNQAGGGTFLGSSPQTVGSPTYPWGIALTPAIINDASFGWVVSLNPDSGTVEIDSVEADVFYLA